MGIAIAQATLQSLVDEHTGVLYKEALEEIRAYIADVQPSSLQQMPKCKCGADAVYHYCRICWCMEIDSHKQSDTSA